jgi:tetratricopeptide (TPR) repeat protein
MIPVIMLLVLFFLQAERLSASIEINSIALAVMQLSRGLDPLASTCEPTEIVENDKQSGINVLLAHFQSRQDDDMGRSTRVANLLQAAMQLNQVSYLQEIQEIAPLAGQFGEFRLGLAKFVSGDFDGAAQIWDILGAGRYPLGAGDACRILGRNDAAAKWYQLAAKLDSVRGRALLELGLIEYSKGIFDVAKERFIGALNQGYQTAVVYEYLGAAMAKSGRYGDAVQVLEQGLDKFPESLALWLWYAESQYQMGRLEQSISSYHKALGIDQGSIYAHIGLAKAYFHSGNRVAALIETRTSLDLVEQLEQPELCRSIMSLVLALSDTETSIRAARTCSR